MEHEMKNSMTVYIIKQKKKDVAKICRHNYTSKITKLNI